MRLDHILLAPLLSVGMGTLWVNDAAAERLPVSVALADALDERVIGGLIAYPSLAYADFQRFTKAAPQAQLVSLLHHENRVVRAYVAQYLSPYLPAHAAAFYPLLADTDRIAVHVPTCEGGKSTSFLLTL